MVHPSFHFLYKKSCLRWICSSPLPFPKGKVEDKEKEEEKQALGEKAKGAAPLAE